MPELFDGMRLYHGSYCEVKNPDLAKCAAYKDFGKGFYLTSSKEQAESFVIAALKKAKAQGITAELQGYGVVSTFCYHYGGSITDFIFREVDANWLHCVVGNRKTGTFPDIVEEMKKYDVIVGKIADDATNVTILTYLIEAYGRIGSREADDLCISRLIPERLKDQFCFKTEESLKCLSFVESERILEELKEVTEEQKKFAIDAMVALVVEELVNDLRLEPTKVLKDFVASKTGALLYDESSKLWWNGSSYIADMYKEEIQKV